MSRKKTSVVKFTLVKDLWRVNKFRVCLALKGERHKELVIYKVPENNFLETAFFGSSEYQRKNFKSSKPSKHYNNVLNNEYKLLEVFSFGGQGVLVKALSSSGRKVLIKFPLSPQNYDNEREKVLYLIKSSKFPHISKILSYDYIFGMPYIVFEYIEGISLGELLANIKSNFLEIPEVCKIMLGIIEGVKTLHVKGIIHCDIKPDNIIITKEDIAKIIDFDCATFENKYPPLGTPGYISPEVLSNEKASRKIDIFQLGALFYKMVTNITPFIAIKNLYDIYIEKPSEINPLVSKDLDNIILGMINVEKVKRFDDLDKISSRLMNYI